MQNDDKEKSLLVLSGGQDSTTCLYWAFSKFGRHNVQAISFDYGQRHKVELKSAVDICQLSSTPHQIIPINTFAALGGSSLTDDIDVSNEVDANTHLPNSFVPGRNLIFLTFAAAFAYQRNIRHLVTGVAQTDYSGYPDCRESTIQALEKSINLGMESAIKIHAPLMHLTKKETVELAVKVKAMDALALSHTCYNGERPGCKNCPACLLRAQGFAQANVLDPLFT